MLSLATATHLSTIVSLLNATLTIATDATEIQIRATHPTVMLSLAPAYHKTVIIQQQFIQKLLIHNNSQFIQKLLIHNNAFHGLQLLIQQLLI
jgi:hypothetical protein